MLKNVPNADSMEQVSLRLYFTAWDHVLEIIFDIFTIESHAKEADPFIDGKPFLPFSVLPSLWSVDKDNFITRAQPDLQLAYTLIQQSQEIALKAKICAVNPFLLLLGSDVRTWPKSDADFTQFRTLDASDLVKVVNTVCEPNISPRFSEIYQSVRGTRNTIYHLGTYNDRLDPKILLNILVTQYGELYRGRVWLRDRQNFQTQLRQNLSVTNTFNNKTTILMELIKLFDVLTDSQYRVICGFSKKTRRYICHSCCYDAGIRDIDIPPEDIRTATVIKEKDVVFCHVCEKEYPIRRNHCVNVPCKSNVISEDEDWADHCHVCGKDQKGRLMHKRPADPDFVCEPGT